MLITDILIPKRNFSLFISALIKRSKRSKGHLSRADSCPHTVSNLDSSPPPLLTTASCCIHPPPPSNTYHLATCPLPGTSAAGSAGSGCGWCGRSGSSSGGGRSRLHCSADSSWRSPARGERGHRKHLWLSDEPLDRFMPSQCSSADRIPPWLIVIHCIPSGDIFIFRLPNRWDNSATAMVFSPA